MNQHVAVPTSPTEPAPVDILRIDTAVSRYPIHRLASKGNVNINIRRKDPRGTTTLLWEVDYSNKYGQPGPLAYKLDTHVINRKIDEAGRPIPRVLKLGSLHEIATELSLDRNTTAVRKALLQNVGAIINAKMTYKASDKTERSLESAFSRYSVIFTGEKLPDGRRADAVYLVLNELYAEVLNAASRRPLDYDYLRDLTPGPQRFYEIVSYEMLPAIKYNQRAKLPYSEFCLYSTMTRYAQYEQVKKQMWKIHQPHIKAGYIAKVEIEAAIDEEGLPDWNMFYTPGETARRQQLAFDFGIPTLPRKTLMKPQRVVAKAVPQVAAATTSQLPLLSEPKPSEEAAVKLVEKFYVLRYGQPQLPTEREIGEAIEYLSSGEPWAEFLIAFGAQHGKEKDGFPNDFGGVKKLASQARVPFTAKRKELDQAALKQARQAHQEVHRAAYLVFLRELLGGKLESSLPGAYETFVKQEKSTYQFHSSRAEKSEMSAKIIENYYSEEVRLERLVRFIAENPTSGLPNFWQWDAKFNMKPFRPIV